MLIGHPALSMYDSVKAWTTALIILFIMIGEPVVPLVDPAELRFTHCNCTQAGSSLWQRTGWRSMVASVAARLCVRKHAFCPHYEMQYFYVQSGALPAALVTAASRECPLSADQTASPTGLRAWQSART